MTFTIGNKFNYNKFIPPTNTGLEAYAQARLNNIIPRAIQKHSNSLSVDGIYLYLWQKTRTAPVCTCSGSKTSKDYSDNIAQKTGNVNTDLKIPKTNNIPNLPPNVDSFASFSFSTNRDTFLDDESGPPEIAFNNQQLPLDNGNGELDINDILENLSEPVDPETLARLVAGASSGMYYGGDKTQCGICYSSGFVNGYTLYNGQRFVLDASGNFPFELINGAVLNTNTHPNSFELQGQAYVKWYVDVPPYLEQWLNIAISNNMKSAQGLILEALYNSVWQEITLDFLLTLIGSSDLQSLPIRVRINSDSGSSLEKVTFTHAEFSCMYGVPLLGQSPLVSYNLNWDQQEPLIQTNFEILGIINDIPRETIIQDTRLNMLWKTLEVTKKITSSNMVFGYDVNVRRVATSEVQYKMLLPYLQPQNNLNQLPVR
jgi:hypothetical protein